METQVGHFIYVYAPLEYVLLMEWSKAMKESFGKAVKLSPRTIETFSIYSGNPIFKTARFRKALIKYRKDGLKPMRKTGWQLKDALYFAKHSYQIYEDIKKCAL